MNNYLDSSFSPWFSTQISSRPSTCLVKLERGFEDVPSSFELNHLTLCSPSHLAPHLSHVSSFSPTQILGIGLPLLLRVSLKSRRRSSTTPSLPSRREHQVEVVANVLVQVGHQVVVVPKVQVHLTQFLLFCCHCCGRKTDFSVLRTLLVIFDQKKLTCTWLLLLLFALMLLLMFNTEVVKFVRSKGILISILPCSINAEHHACCIYDVVWYLSCLMLWWPPQSSCSSRRWSHWLFLE